MSQNLAKYSAIAQVLAGHLIGEAKRRDPAFNASISIVEEFGKYTDALSVSQLEQIETILKLPELVIYYSRPSSRNAGFPCYGEDKEFDKILKHWKPLKELYDSFANALALAGHPDNIWRGPDYEPGKSVLIVLESTYWEGTGPCLEQFLDGEWDHTFSRLIDGVISRGQCTRREAMKSFALMNFTARILPDSKAIATYADYSASEPLFAKRLIELDPKFVWILGGSQKDVVNRVIENNREALHIGQIYTDCHPACPGDATVNKLTTTWDLMGPLLFLPV